MRFNIILAAMPHRNVTMAHSTIRKIYSFPRWHDTGPCGCILIAKFLIILPFFAGLAFGHFETESGRVDVKFLTRYLIGEERYNRPIRMHVTLLGTVVLPVQCRTRRRSKIVSNLHTV